MKPKTQSELLTMFQEQDASAMKNLVEQVRQSKLESEIASAADMLKSIFEQIRSISEQGKTSYTVKYESGVCVGHVINTLKSLGYKLATDFDAGRSVIVIKWDNNEVTKR